jgi:predicted GNAT superfamily acetyltransferase
MRRPDDRACNICSIYGVFAEIDSRSSSVSISKPVTPPTVRIEPLIRLQDFGAAVDLERTIWGYRDLDIDSCAILIIASRFIGQIFGAYDANRLVGMALAFYADKPACLHSHRVGILPEYQNQGIGYRLKLAQRDDALARGIGTIQWTFDSLQSRNAYFNLSRLGGIARTYIPNLYGATSSPLHVGLPTDRILIEWHLEDARVTDILSGRKPAAQPGVVRIELPPRERRTDSGEQQRMREAFQEWFSKGYALTGFVSDQGRDTYLLEIL